MNWKKRAREVLGRNSERQIKGTVEEIAAESDTVASDLPFLLESAGAHAISPLSLDKEGLKAAEKAYRSLEQDFRASAGTARVQIERLLGIFLGRVLIEKRGGKWVFYQGRYHTLSPVVVRLPSGKHLDVFGFCRDLYLDKCIVGARTSEALACFFDSAEMVGFPNRRVRS